MTVPLPQFHLLSRSIFEVLILTQFLINCPQTLYIVLHMSYVVALTPTSSKFCFLNFQFFIPSIHMLMMIKHPPYKMEHVWCPEEIHASPPVGNNDGWIFPGQSEQYVQDAGLCFGRDGS